MNATAQRFPASVPWYYFLAAALAALLLALAVLWASGSDDPEESVFRVYVERGANAYSGTSFLVSGDNTVITNYHVIQNPDKVLIEYRRDGETITNAATVLWHSKEQDLAILQTRNSLRGKPLVLADISDRLPGKKEPVSAIGFPGIASSTQVTGRNTDASLRGDLIQDATISTGTIQRLVPGVDRVLIQHSADIHGGNSGGPLLDECNRVVGVNTLGWALQTLEYSVHIKHVLRALNREELASTTAGGSCVWGMTAGTRYLVGSSMIAALALFGLAAASFRGASSPQPDQTVDMTGGENVNLMAGDGGETVFLHDPVATPSVSSVVLRANGPYGDLMPEGPSLATSGLVLGRAGAGADLAINDASVSRRHARLTQSESELLLADMGSTNGTTVNGRLLPQDRTQPLADGDTVRFGDATYRVEMAGGAMETHGDAAHGQEWLLSGFDRRGKTVQQVISGPTGAGAFTAACRIGRAADNDLVLDDDSVSRHHAVIGYDENGVLTVRDLGSSNGTMVDNRPIEAGQKALASAKSISFGEISLSLSRIR